MGALLQFLARNTIDKTQPLPLVHTCEAYHLKHILLRDHELRPSKCQVFNGENLLYFFVGRPAYKKEIDLEPKYWELPVCFIVEFDVGAAKRIFPFDTGAFSRGLMPNFLSMVEMSEFDVSADIDAVPKIIGTFFPDRLSYFRTKPRSESDFNAKYHIDVLDEEVRALHTLITTNTPKTADDRRASIEVSFDHAFPLRTKRVLAVVIPEIYVRSQEIIEYIELTLKAEPITYPEYQQNISFYYACIYQKVEEFYRQRGMFRV